MNTEVEEIWKGKIRSRGRGEGGRGGGERDGNMCLFMAGQ